MARAKPSDYVVVTGAGTDDEKIVHTAPKFMECAAYVEKKFGRNGRISPDKMREKGIDIMSRWPDGTLSTEI